MQQRIAIIGGGIAGLAFAVYYKKLGGRVDIYERSALSGREGLGFIMLENGLNALNQLGMLDKTRNCGYTLSGCNIRDQHNTNLQSHALPNSFATTRKAFIDCLLSQIPAQWLHFNYQFSHFEFEPDGRASTAVFEGNKRIQADIFLGCDGGRSKVRQQIFPTAQASHGKVNELVSIIDDVNLVKDLNRHFVKYKLQEGGLAVGMVPASSERIVWFIQFDNQKYQLTGQNQSDMWQFAQQTVGHFPKPVQHLIKYTDFNCSHLWQTRYLEPIAQYFHRNIVLLGDAAHALLPFTSQGVNSAMVDAIELASSLIDINAELVPLALAQYSKKRKLLADCYLSQGIVLQDEFLQCHHHEQKVPFAF